MPDRGHPAMVKADSSLCVICFQGHVTIDYTLINSDLLNCRNMTKSTCHVRSLRSTMNGKHFSVKETDHVCSEKFCASFSGFSDYLTYFLFGCPEHHQGANQKTCRFNHRPGRAW